MGAFGERIGLAFQILDDVLDVSGPPERTGKPRGADLLDGTVTLPLILAREPRPGARSARRARRAAPPTTPPAVCDRIAATGVLETREVTRARARRPRPSASCRACPTRQRTALELVADGRRRALRLKQLGRRRRRGHVAALALSP